MIIKVDPDHLDAAKGKGNAEILENMKNQIHSDKLLIEDLLQMKIHSDKLLEESQANELKAAEKLKLKEKDLDDLLEQLKDTLKHDLDPDHLDAAKGKDNAKN